jgi:hypothetical protein
VNDTKSMGCLRGVLVAFVGYLALAALFVGAVLLYGAMP